MSDDALELTLYGRRLGALHPADDGPTLEWDLSYPAIRGARVLSASLRFGIDAPTSAVSDYFGGLLPEGQWLDRLANEVGVSHRDVLGLLRHVGSDVAGALVVGAGREATEPRRLGADELPRLLAEAGGYTVGGGGSSLPGYQRKIALTRHDGDWWLGNGTMPSTHILKPVSADREDLAHSEDYLLTLARHLGLSPFQTWTENIEGTPTLIIERYDRALTGARITRIHQEDAAQALSLPWLSDAKFEENDARANLRSVAALLDTERTVFDRTEPDRRRLLRYVTFHVAVGNTDAHAKNYSILRPEDAAPRLAPLYDTVPLALSATARKSLAMKVSNQSLASEVTREQLIDEGTSWGLRENDASAAVDETLNALLEAAETEPAHPAIAQRVPGFVRAQTRNLIAGDRAGIRGAIPVYHSTAIGSPGPTAG